MEKIKIQGMSCQHCVGRVKKALEALPGVAEVNVDLTGATVKHDEAKTGVAELEAAVAKTGYKVVFASGESA